MYICSIRRHIFLDASFQAFIPHHVKCETFPRGLPTTRSLSPVENSLSGGRDYFAALGPMLKTVLLRNRQRLERRRKWTLTVSCMKQGSILIAYVS